VLQLALTEQRILITDDRDFGELVFRLRQPHAGVIYLRLGEEADLATKISRLSYVLTHYANRLDQFLVVTPHRVRIRSRS
jgi:predicted nuclease of predicted toxin-antitoxin system